MASGKCELHTYFTFLQRILTSTHTKYLIFFAIYMSRCPTFTFQFTIMSKGLAEHKFPTKLLLGKDMFTLIIVDLENETSISIWEFEKMNVLK